jgi:hypothetical protein
MSEREQAPTRPHPFLKSEAVPEFRSPKITGIDFESEEWKKVRAAFSARVDELYKLCARPGITEREADEYRGALRELTAILDLDEKRKHIPSDIY